MCSDQCRVQNEEEREKELYEAPLLRCCKILLDCLIREEPMSGQCKVSFSHAELLSRNTHDVAMLGAT